MAAQQEDGPPGVPEWVVTYGDMMSLLLTFFIMLVSMSEVRSDDGKVRAMLDALVERFGPTMGKSGVPGKSRQASSAMTELSSQGVRSEGGTKKASRSSKGGSGANKTVKRINHGTVVTMGGPTVFRRFDASLTDELKANLDVLVEVLSTRPNRLVVRGHASPEPLPRGKVLNFHGIDVHDQLDLSYARARTVAQYLVSNGIERRRLLVSAVGSTEPRMLTRQQDVQRLNRRVDVFLIDSYIVRPDSPEPAKLAD